MTSELPIWIVIATSSVAAAGLTKAFDLLTGNWQDIRRRKEILYMRKLDKADILISSLVDMKSNFDVIRMYCGTIISGISDELRSSIFEKINSEFSEASTSLRSITGSQAYFLVDKDLKPVHQSIANAMRQFQNMKMADKLNQKIEYHNEAKELALLCERTQEPLENLRQLVKAEIHK